MRVFVDTSAFLAILTENDKNYQSAEQVWHYLIDQDAILVCTNYILVESFALIQNRLGMTAVKAFEKNIMVLRHKLG